MRLPKNLFVTLYGLLLTAFTIYVLLDTFVIARVYRTESVDTGDTNAEITADSSPDTSTDVTETDSPTVSQTPIITKTSYVDEDISITLTEYREYDTTIYVADITLRSADYLKTALAENSYGKNVTEKTSEIAVANNAILAINGDFYGAQEKGYVLKNGILYRETAERNQEDLVIYEDGSFSVITEKEVAATDLLSDGAVQILSFGPALVIDGEISVAEEDEVGKAMTSNPRTAIGMVDDLHYLFVVSDGRTKESEGLSLLELATFMKSLGASTAYNLDGGGSSTMYFNGEIINNPTTNGKNIKERSVSDIVYIGY